MGKYNIFKFNFTVTSLKVLIAFNLKNFISTLTNFQQNLEIHKLRENGVSKYVWWMHIHYAKSSTTNYLKFVQIIIRIHFFALFIS